MHPQVFRKHALRVGDPLTVVNRGELEPTWNQVTVCRLKGRDLLITNPDGEQTEKDQQRPSEQSDSPPA
jgi:hypothetical protein